MLLKINNYSSSKIYYRSPKDEKRYVVVLQNLTNVDLVNKYYPLLFTTYFTIPNKGGDNTLEETVDFIIQYFGIHAIKQGLDKLATLSPESKKYSGELTDAEKIAVYIEKIVNDLNQEITPARKDIKNKNTFNIYDTFLATVTDKNSSYGWDGIITDNGTICFLVYDVGITASLKITDYYVIHRLLKARYEGTLLEIYCDRQNPTTYSTLEEQLLFDRQFRLGNGLLELNLNTMFCDFSLDKYMKNQYDAIRVMY